MHSTNKNQSGFTLVEILVIAPLIVIMIAVLISTMVIMVGEILRAREQNRQSLEISQALQTIDTDVRMSTQILRTTGPVAIPYGKDNGIVEFATSVDANNGNNILSTSQLGLTDKPDSANRKLIYYQNAPTTMPTCNSLGLSNNNLFKVNVIYFLKNNTLYRRTIVPPFNKVKANRICGTPYQKSSCTNPASNTSDDCYVQDSALLKNVTAFKLRYFVDPSSESPITIASQVNNAKSVEVYLSTAVNVTGDTISRSSKIRSITLNAK